MKKIVLVRILLVIVAIGLVYFVVSRPTEQATQNAMSPKEVYLALKAESATAENLDSMIGIYQKYLTGTFFQENKIKVQSVPANQKIQVFETLKSRVVPLSDININTIVENIIGDNATVIAYTKDYASVATINLTKENRTWRVNSSEVWVNGKGK